MVPGLLVGSVFILTVVGLFWTPGFMVLAALSLLYAVAALTLSLIIAARTNWSLFPALPGVVWCFHFGYGYGFLRGIFDFVVLHNAPQTQFVQLTRETRVNLRMAVLNSQG